MEEISFLKSLQKNISSLSQSSSFSAASLDLNHKSYQKVEELLNLLKHVLDAVVNSDLASDDTLKEDTRHQGEEIASSLEILAKVMDCLRLKPDKEILIKAEKLIEEAERIEEATLIDQMIALLKRLHDQLVLTEHLPVAGANRPVLDETRLSLMSCDEETSISQAVVASALGRGVSHADRIVNELIQSHNQHGLSDRHIPRVVQSPTLGARVDLVDDEAHVRKLVKDLKSESVETQRGATAEIRLLAKHKTDNRTVIANCGAIRSLVDLLHSTDTTVQENAVTAILNLSIEDNNKAAIVEAHAIEPLIHVLETGSPEAKSNSAATLFSLSNIENTAIIGRSGAIKPLVDLLGNGTPGGKKDAITALFKLSLFHENKAGIVKAGAVTQLIRLTDPAVGMVEKAVAVLANLASIPEGRMAIGRGGGIPVLVEVVELGSARGKENAVAALLRLCESSSRFLNMALKEGVVPPLMALSQSGTLRAKEKALQLLNLFKNQRHDDASCG